MSDKSQMILYADDIVLTHPLDAHSSEDELQADINEVNQVIKSLDLKLNAKKCLYQIFSLAPQGPKKGTSFSSGNTPLQQTSTYCYLGVDMDERLTFSKQTRKAATKAKQCIGALSRALRKWSPPKLLATAITTIALPSLFYAIEV